MDTRLVTLPNGEEITTTKDEHGKEFTMVNLPNGEKHKVFLVFNENDFKNFLKDGQNL